VAALAAPRENLATLEAERRGVPLTFVLAEAVIKFAADLRRGRKPRTGYARTTDGLSAAELTAELVAQDFRG
jgi:chromosome condensin MukBEF MukE localization factor